MLNREDIDEMFNKSREEDLKNAKPILISKKYTLTDYTEIEDTEDKYIITIPNYPGRSFSKLITITIDKDSEVISESLTALHDVIFGLELAYRSITNKEIEF